MNKLKDYIKNNKRSAIAFVITLVVWLLLLSAYKQHTKEEIKEITYNEFLQCVDSGEVDTVYYSKSSDYMTVTLLNDDTKDMSRQDRDDYSYAVKDKRTVPYPGYSDFKKDMLEKDVNIVTMKSSLLENMLSLLISLAFPLIWIAFMVKMMRSQMHTFDKTSVIQTSNTTFEDVIGQDEIIDDLQFVVDLIKNPNKHNAVGAKVPKGILLTGVPGTGKTLIAKAIAGEANVPFISVSGSDFKELYVGMGAKKVRDLFKIARANAPCIIFIDEIDSVGAKRDSNLSNSEDDQTINALLKEMDGFSGREGVFILAATNHPEHLDSALVRSGRFDRQIVINPPRDWQIRKELFSHYLADCKLADDVDIDTLAKTVSGFTGADIAMVCNEAGIIAMMKNKDYIDNACLEEAIDKKVFNGNRSKKEGFKKDKEIVAYHESGHAVMTFLLNKPIARVSIIGTTSGVGGAVFRQDSNSCFMTDEEMREHVMIAYAGRASEDIKYNTVTTGASNDITQATEVIMAYIERYGFNKDFGLLDLQVLSNKRIIDNTQITERMSDMSKELYGKTYDMLKHRYNLVEKLADELLSRETLSGEEVKQLLEAEGNMVIREV